MKIIYKVQMKKIIIIRNIYNLKEIFYSRKKISLNYIKNKEFE